MDYFDKTVAVAWLILTYQQNRILAKGNPVESKSETATERFRHQLTRFWPSIVGLFVILALFARPYFEPAGRILGYPRDFDTGEIVSAPAPVPARPTERESSPIGITDNKNWFRVSDADKWKTTKAIRDLKLKDLHFQIVRYDTPQCEDLAQDIEEIFEAAGGTPINPPGTPISGNLPKGIVLRGQQSEPGASIQFIFTQDLKYKPDSDASKDDLPYLTISVGNPPES